MGLLNSQSDQPVDFGQLLKRHQRQQFFGLLGQGISALINKAQGRPNVKMPQARVGSDPFKMYYRLMLAKSLQQKMQAAEAKEARTVERRAEEEGVRGRLLGMPWRPGLLQQEGVDPAAGLLARLGKYPEAIDRAWPAQRATAPTIREFNQPGGTQQARRFDPRTRTWVDMGEPTQRWRPSERGGLTTSQGRENATIDQARAALDKLGMSREAIIEASQEATATGRENPDFNPYIAGLARQATRRKLGDDPDFEKRFNFLHVPPPEPAPEDQAAGAAAPEPEGPSPWDRAMGAFGFGEPDAASPGLPSGPPAGPVGGLLRPGLRRPAREGQEAPGGLDELPISPGRGRFPRGPRGMRGRAQPLPRNATGKVDTMKLRRGATYQVPRKDGGVDLVRWNGKRFIPVQE